MVKTGFFDYLDFALQFAPAGPEEKEICAKLARLGSVRERNSASKTFPVIEIRSRYEGEGGPRFGYVRIIFGPMLV